jgi:dextranase
MTNDLFARSIEIIKANQAPSGAYIASPNFEQYHYCWFRDGAYTAYALDLAGEHDSSSRFYDWAANNIAGRAAQVERAATAAARGQMPAPGDILHTRYTMDGADSPDDWPNFQLDGFGTLLWGMSRHLDLTGRSLDAVPASWSEAVTLLVQYLSALWSLPCYDCWEEFPDKLHTYTMASIYGGLRAASSMLASTSARSAADLASGTAARIKQFVLDNCVLDGSLVKFKGSPLVDGSLICVSTPYGLFAPDDPVMQTTIARIESDLRRDGGGVHRYIEDSYYGGGEWLLLTAYLGWYYAECGETGRAQALLDWVEACAGAQDDLPEQVSHHLNQPDMLPVWEARWGRIATPLLWSHAAYVTLAANLGRTTRADVPSSSAIPGSLSVLPDKATYRPGDTANISVTLEAMSTPVRGKLVLSVRHLDLTISTYEQNIEFDPGNGERTSSFTFTPPATHLRGYGLDAALYGEHGDILAEGSGALDVLDRWSQAPRYGFLSDFAPEQLSTVEARVNSLRRYHLNVVQFYDWMWRHYRLMPPTDEFTEALGRNMSLVTIRAAIEGVQSGGGAAMAYGAVYGAEPEYADQHPDLVLYDEVGKPISLAELFYIMNISPGSPWVDLIVAQFADAVRRMGFDGIHLDQYGFPKTAYSASGEPVDLATSFPSLIDRSRAAVVAERPSAGVIFNAVDNWPIEAVAPTTQDAVYIEVWPPYETYNDLGELIRRGKELGGDKQVILAAYLTPFLDAGEQDVPGAEAAALLATAVIAAHGGFHLLLGERDGVLCDPYYPKYATLRPEFAALMRRYYDFLVRYEELLVAPDIHDWDANRDDSVTLAGAAVSMLAEPGTVWAVLRRSSLYRIVHLVNLAGQESIDWNALRTSPSALANREMKIHDVPPVAQVLVLTPEEPRAVYPQWSQEGDVVTLQLPRLTVWAVVVCVLEDKHK